MKAVLPSGFGGPEVLRIGECPDPSFGKGDLLVRVRAAGLNRADLLQRRGKYPPPAGASEILGLEIAGEVADAGRAVAGVSPGDRVCAILPGGGYAELAAVPADMAMPIPPGLSFEQGAAIPEAFLTAYRNLFPLGLLRPGETVLVHAGGSGVGTAAIQLIREGGGRSLVTAGSPEKISRCRELGAEGGWNYREGPFAPWVASRTSGKGVDIVLDCVGAPYLDQNLRSLARGGRLLVIGMMGGSRAEGIDLARILMNHLSIKGSTLRHLDREEKERLVREFSAFALPRFADGRLVPVVDSVFDWTDAASAHERMESNANVGKIVLSIPER
ncbi:MAG TPA: NADPH:quinone oxidoreductase [Deltaproteobacteria bacterium]|nr:MAG: NADPH:quinone oxidoreductase [Deltaproteobacteria bacterium GWC2_65_14]HBO69671.1 NADPH:quinone oxidoreductase [Deltaproteobacteria bacterium]